MSIYNYLEFKGKCPHCLSELELEVDFRFGFRNLDRYRIGDELRWHGDGLNTPKRRPSQGNYVGDGYVECPNCKKDSWVKISIEGDVIKSVDVDHARGGYIPDEVS
jgi:hypothetical protein